MVKNLELAQIFKRMADFLEMENVSFKSRAYAKVARVLESARKDVSEIYQEGGSAALEDIPGVGKNIAEKIEEYLKTGEIKDYQKLKKESPVDLEALTAIEGIGSQTIKVLYKELGIRNVKDLEKAARVGKISKLEGFGEKKEKNILEGIEFVKQNKGRFLLGIILPIVQEIIGRLNELPEVSQVSVAGSTRRMKETVGDIDILAVSSQPEKVMDFFVKMPEVVKIWGKGKTKSSVRFQQGLDCDLRLVKKESYGSALQYFTGSRDHNIMTRRLALSKKLKLNEYGLFKGEKRIAGQTEKGIYQAIGLPYIEPELRTNQGEIEIGLQQMQGKAKLPQLISYNDIKGETHCHTEWSDGLNTIEEMAKKAKEIGYQYLIITDHAGFLKIAHGLEEKRLLKQMSEIDKINQRITGIKILKGCEVDINLNGTLAIKDEILAKLDVVLAAVHSGFKMNKEDMTKRIIRAIQNQRTNIIVHPTGRLIQKREEYQFDFTKVFQEAVKNKTALEINAHLNRLDLKDTNVRQAIESGAKLTIGTDSHSIDHFWMMKLGIATARRGWAEKKDILNTGSLKEFLDYFRNKD